MSNDLRAFAHYLGMSETVAWVYRDYLEEQYALALANGTWPIAREERERGRAA